MEPLGTDLNALFQIDEELENELKVDEKDFVCPPSTQPIGLPDHLKSFAADCGMVFGQSFPEDFASLKDS